MPVINNSSSNLFITIRITGIYRNVKHYLLILEISFASVHFPTTSTAIVAEDLGISSVYYDANSLVDIDDKGLSGIKLIQGKKNLYKWKNSLKKQFTN